MPITISNPNLIKKSPICVIALAIGVHKRGKYILPKIPALLVNVPAESLRHPEKRVQTIFPAR